MCRPTPNILRRSRCSPRASRRCTSTASGKCRPSPTSPSRASSASSGAPSSCRSSSTMPAPIRTRTPSRSRTMSARTMTPEKRAAVLKVIGYMLSKGLFWATAGHIPALKSVTDSAEYQAMQPNATYAVLTANMVYDPKSKFAGVASPMYERGRQRLHRRGQRRGGPGGGRRPDEGRAGRPAVGSA